MMKNLNKIYSLLLLTLLVTGLFLTSCKKDEEVSTKIVLNSYGPSPALRGGELKFIGLNLDQVTSIILPDNIEIKAESFTSKTAALITITVPEATMPGTITLKTPQGDIQPKTALGISEPIAITSFEPITLRPGETVTIKGTYLNLIKQVIFNSNKTVSEFISQSKDQIVVKVPLDAKTGTIVVSNGEAEPIMVESENPLTVTLPAFSAVSPNPVKAGTKLTIAGTNLDLVKSISFAGGASVTTFNSQTSTQIELTVPANAQDGKIKMIVASLAEVESTADLTMVVPTISQITPAVAKTSGDITITGTDLDLVTNVWFDKVEGTIKTKEATQLVVKVPATAAETAISLITASGKSVKSSNIVALVLPTISSITPPETVTNADITITGTNLDVVAKVVFTGGNEVNVTGNATSIVVNVPSGTLTGTIKLVTTNASEVISTASLTIIVSNVPNITSMPADVKPGEILTIIGEKLDLLTDVIFPGDVKATMFGIKTATKLEVFVPLNVKKGTGKIKFITKDNETTESPEIFIGGTDPVVDASLVIFNFDGKNSWWQDKGAIDKDAALSLDGSGFYHVNDNCSGWTGFFWRNGKSDLPADVIGTHVADYVYKFDINIIETITGGEFAWRLKGTSGDFWYRWKPWSTTGSYKTEGWITITVPLTSFATDGGIAISDLSTIDSDFGVAFNAGSSKVNACIDNVRFEKIK
jgi:hypothetical protein